MDYISKISASFRQETCEDVYIKLTAEYSRSANSEYLEIALPNQQVSLKPQDLVVLVKLLLTSERPCTYASVGKSLFISSSEVHASVSRMRLAQLMGPADIGSDAIIRPAFRELLLHGARFVFPAVMGSLVRGMPTAHASPAFLDVLVQANEPPPVWPYAKGTVRGIALYPLYPSVPRAAANDPNLYRALALFDALRVGRTRERDIATAELSKLVS